MSRLLAIEVSPCSDHSTSRKLTAAFIEQWKTANGVDRWPQRGVAAKKRINHRSAGRMRFEFSSLGVGDPPDVKLIVCTPLDEECTPQKLNRLLCDHLL
jgi:hypothetical protein